MTRGDDGAEGATRGLIVFDLEQTLTDGSDPPACRLRPGAEDWLRSLELLGFEIHIWTRARRDYALSILQALRLDRLAERLHEKPRWEESTDITLEDCESILGVIPVLQVDDWPEERVEGIPFLEVKPWMGEDIEGGW